MTNIKIDESENKPNHYEQYTLISEEIENLSRRLGEYLSVDGCEKTDEYAISIISAIQRCRQRTALMLSLVEFMEVKREWTQHQT